MSGAAVRQSPAAPDSELREPDVFEEQELGARRERQAELLRLLWNRRQLLLRAVVVGALGSIVIAFLIPKSYTSTTQLMPPDTQSTSGLAMMAALADKAGSGLGPIAGDLLGLKSSGDLFIGVLKSQTVQDDLVEEFGLRKEYGERLLVDARTTLDENTVVSEDRKSGIISITVTDRNPQRAAALANSYVDRLNSLISELSTSSAHRERVFLEGRLKTVKEDLDQASDQLARFSSKNGTLDIQQEGKAILDAASSIAGEMIAARSQLEGLRQIYTDNNPRVRSLNARVEELRGQLQRLGGAQGNVADRADSTSGQPADPPPAETRGIPFPTIRNLPFLGAEYADYYRRAKIEETVYELLTDQYELAKVEEAKETPSVKVLDPARIPEKKSFPPRSLIVFLGTCLALSVALVWILGSSHWQSITPDDPRKLVAQEALATLRSRVLRFSRNGRPPVVAKAPVADMVNDFQATTDPSMKH